MPAGSHETNLHERDSARKLSFASVSSALASERRVSHPSRSRRQASVWIAVSVDG